MKVFVLFLSLLVAEGGIVPVREGEVIKAPFSGRLVRQDIYEEMVRCGIERKWWEERYSLLEEKEKKICEERLKFCEDSCDLKLKYAMEFEKKLVDSFGKSRWYDSELIKFLIVGIIVVGIVWGVSYGVNR